MFLTILNMINHPEIMFAILIAFISALFICMPFHEFAHAHAALKEGDYTGRALNRYTLAPHAHIDISGFLMLLFFGIGFAKPVPVDVRNFKRGRKSELRVAFSGVLINLLIGSIACFIYAFLENVWPDLFFKYGFISLLYNYFFNFLISLNFMFAFFNLLPIYPLDGYRVVSACSKTDNSFLRFMRVNGFWVMLILLFTGIFDLYIGYIAGGISSLLINWFEAFFKIII